MRLRADGLQEALRRCGAVEPTPAVADWVIKEFFQYGAAHEQTFALPRARCNARQRAEANRRHNALAMPSQHDLQAPLRLSRARRHGHGGAPRGPPHWPIAHCCSSRALLHRLRPLPMRRPFYSSWRRAHIPFRRAISLRTTANGSSLPSTNRRPAGRLLIGRGTLGL